MTTDEAIRILDTAQSDLSDPPPSRFSKALLLGIEALKFYRGEKEAGYIDKDDLLPGETEEKQRAD